ncbi:thiolase domain-containing protein [Caldisalinibacter kiritimatiensis]|uniref:3-ketoacyl-CoA thiolase n=1 Tax=Caldisalinibacter kiritimatiensis TaxID=1304284 RepID=R1CDF3_9FIRM|nr:thiolase domain-containing protein [Caldisalinibacter kiritimatiensis]EOD00320.1 3-ketoacyl-CoA thiolase [Caldisalinibacter kiritimatiensis]
MSVSIVGTYHSKVGRLKEETLYSLLVEAGKGALEDANLTGKDIDAVYVGNYSGGGFNHQEHLAPYAIEIDEGLRFKPCIRVENACASGSTAVEEAMMAIQAGKIKTALVIGVEKMTSLNTKGVTDVLAMASYYPVEGSKGYTFPGLYAEYAKGYMKKYGYSIEELYDTLAHISVKAHKNAMSNPLAQMHVEYTHEAAKSVHDKNPMIADPLKLSDCSLISDGAAALVLTTTENAKAMKDEVVEIQSLVHASDHLSIVEGKRSNYELTAAKYAVKKALEEVNLTIDDIDVAEVHDCFTITELLIYEALGLAPDGKGREALDNGIVYPGGKLPVNLSGGLKAKGHPVGATGASMHVLIARQLLGNAIGLQAEGAEIGLTLNIGGSGATNIASILKRIK